jgi:hypothetical protein
MNRKLLILVLAALGTACDNALEPAPKPIVTRVAITPAGDAALDVNGQLQLGARAYAADGTEILGRVISWTSDRESVASVTGAGRVAAHGDGTATIRATIDGVAAHKTVTVRSPAERAPVAAVRVSPAEITLEPGSAHQFSVRVLAADSTELLDRPVQWTSSNQDLATVSATGRVEAHRGGVVWIAATSEGKSDQVRIVIPDWSEAPLALVAGSSLPAELSRGTITDDNGIEVTRIIRIVAGHLRVNLGEQIYEQQFTLERWEQTYTIVDGHPVYWGMALMETRVYQDHGAVAPLYEGTQALRFQSAVHVSSPFNGLRTERGFDVTQRILNAGALRELRFVR